MSEKNLDVKGRWRSRYVGFRMSPEEDEHLEAIIRVCGVSKQDYIISRLEDRSIVVKGNPKVYKALKNQMAEILDELKRIKGSESVDDELLDTIHMIAKIMDGLKNETK